METVKELMHGMANDIQVVTFGINGGEVAVSAKRMLEAAEGLSDKFHALQKTLPPEVYDLEVTE
jgi:hypothetical protein